MEDVVAVVCVESVVVVSVVVVPVTASIANVPVKLIRHLC